MPQEKKLQVWDLQKSHKIFVKKHEMHVANSIFEKTNTGGFALEIDPW